MKRLAVAAAAIALWSATLLAEGPTTAPAPATGPAELTQGFGPIAYFDAHCATCHGPGGSWHGDTFAATLTDEQLRHTVKEMAEGPGNAPLPDPDLSALVAYHRSLKAKQPFLLINHRTPTSLRGEVTPGTPVELITPTQTLSATVNGATWQIDLPPDTDLATAELRAGPTKLTFPRPFSHATP